MLAGRIDRWLTIMALSLEGLGWPTAAELWLAELPRTSDDTPQQPDAASAQSRQAAPEGDET